MSVTLLENTGCAVCGVDNSTPFVEAQNTHGSHFLSGERFTLVKCKSCGLVYINPRPSQTEIKKYYASDYYVSGAGIKASLERLLTNYFLNKKKNLVKSFKKNGKILDVGCGDGRFISLFASDEKWNAYGIEPNPVGYDLSSQISKAKIFNMELSECRFPEADFDVITMWHVLEHIYEPNKLLLEIKRILKGEGILIVGVPHISCVGFRLGKKNWFHLDAPRHTYHYNPQTIKMLLNKNGFDIIKIIYPIIEYPLDLYHSLINSVRRGLKTPLMAPVLGLSLLFKPLFSLLKASKTMIVVCRKGA
ncbi:MAG TPA: hypothetical protein DD725_00690 [Deltaproteobacteria bacterium]|nr:hypothetical protein [Deltaproteobacteria bacterium]